jgi:hypothetical protein
MKNKREKGMKVCKNILIKNLISLEHHKGITIKTLFIISKNKF